MRVLTLANLGHKSLIDVTYLLPDAHIELTWHTNYTKNTDIVNLLFVSDTVRERSIHFMTNLLLPNYDSIYTAIYLNQSSLVDHREEGEY